MNVIPLAKLFPHPQNPRLSPREDVIEQIVAQVSASGFDEAHSLIVRPFGEGYQIISGHNRRIAAQRAGLDAVPCWIREMDDATAYMELVRANAQSELTALERGMHALGFVEKGKHGKSALAYAKAVGREKEVNSVQREIDAAEVLSKIPASGNLIEGWSRLAEIHAAPRWLWRALVSKMAADELTVEATRKMVAGVKDVANLPSWADADKVSEALVSGSMTKSDVAGFSTVVEKSIANIKKLDVEVERFESELMRLLGDAHPSAISAVKETCAFIEHEQGKVRQERQQAEIDEAKRNEKIAARTARLRRNVSLSEWKELKEDERDVLLNLEVGDGGSFNKQENEAIEWAQWSWNPVTGCLHECSYCYARDIANSARTAAAFPNGFDPTFRPSMLLAPRTMKVPKDAEKDARYRNVFTCSMADLFGRWVPPEWIEAVLREVRAAPQWNFLFLTKFPKRMAEFDIPENAWMGTTVDLQARVNNAESAFEKVSAGVRWLSIEPMLEPLKFNHLERFDWIVIGGSSRSSSTPEWKPPFEWVLDLVDQARSAGVKIYFKTNLLGPRMIQLPFDAPAGEILTLPKVFNYLGKKNNLSEAAE